MSKSFQDPFADQNAVIMDAIYHSNIVIRLIHRPSSHHPIVTDQSTPESKNHHGHTASYSYNADRARSPPQPP